MVIIPAATDNSGWAQFRNALVEMHQALESLPPLEEAPASAGYAIAAACAPIPRGMLSSGILVCSDAVPLGCDV
eukprot:scaffold2799_cov408-Prasinococcus_capsulatus_cf.AAC.33